MPHARKNIEANLQNTPASITAIYDKYNPTRPELKDYYLARQNMQKQAHAAVETMTVFVDALTKVKTEIDALKVTKEEVMVRNQYKRLVSSQLTLYSQMLKTAMDLYLYISQH